MRASFIIFLLSIGFFLLSVSAEGADWEFVAINKDGDMFYVDTESIRHISKTVVGARTKMIYKNPHPFHSKEIVEILDYEEHDCVERKQCRLQVTARYSDGTNRSANAPEKKWRYISPYTVDSIIHDYLCKKGK